MQPEQAVFLRDFLVPQIEEENRTTRRILAALPEKRRDFRPHANARSAMELAWHIANSEIWFLEGVIHGQFGSEHERMPPHIRSVTDVITCRERNVPALIDTLRTLPPERLIRGVEFFGEPCRPAVSYLTSMMVHTAHHRGQMAAYLREMGEPVPSIYGGSADEPFPAFAGPTSSATGNR